MHSRRLSVALFLAVACLALGRASGAHAALVVVTNTDDSGPGSLRQAIDDATSGTGILFAQAIQGQTIELHSPLVIDSTMGIDGSDARMTLKAVNHTRVLETSSDMNLANLNVEGGMADKGGAILHTSGQFNFHDSSIKNSTATTDGGGIYVSTGGAAILNNVLIDGNTAGRDGGGLYAETNVTMDLDFMTFTNNQATGRGGGVFLDQASTVLQVVTIANNTAAMGGGIFSNGFFGMDGTVNGNHATENGGGFYINQGEAVLRNATISGNTAASGGAIEMQPGASINMFSGTVTVNTGGGLHFAGGTLNVETTIIADQTTGFGCSGAGGATVVSNGYNLSTDRTCPFNQPTDIQDGYANLGPLTLDSADAHVKTIAPLEGSDALNRIPPAPDAHLDGGPPPDHSVRCGGGELAIDARYITRPQGPGCEIGAYEKIQIKLPRIWGDNLCDGEIDSGDTLTELAFVAGVPWTRVDGCISVGSLVSGDALPANSLQWADVNCDGTLDAFDALDGLRAAVTLPRDHSSACPYIGKDVNLLG